MCEQEGAAEPVRPVTGYGKESKDAGLQKRLHYLKAMLRLDNQTRTKYRALLRNKNRLSQEEMRIVKNLL